MGQVMPYVDILIGNESEAAAWAEANGLPVRSCLFHIYLKTSLLTTLVYIAYHYLQAASDLSAIAKALASQPKQNPSRPRIVVLTSGSDSTVLANSDAANEVPKVYKGQLSDSKLLFSCLLLSFPLFLSFITFTQIHVTQ